MAHKYCIIAPSVGPVSQWACVLCVCAKSIPTGSYPVRQTATCSPPGYLLVNFLSISHATSYQLNSTCAAAHKKCSAVHTNIRKKAHIKNCSESLLLLLRATTLSRGCSVKNTKKKTKIFPTFALFIYLEYRLVACENKILTRSFALSSSATVPSLLLSLPLSALSLAGLFALIVMFFCLVSLLHYNCHLVFHESLALSHCTIKAYVNTHTCTHFS